MKIRRHRLHSLVRRNVRGNEINAAQVATLTCCDREREMPLVDGIEGTAEKAYIHSSSCVVRRASCAKTEVEGSDASCIRRTSSTFSAIAYFSFSMPSPV